MSSVIELNKKDVLRAVNGLLSLSEENKLDIVDTPEKVNLTITFKKVPSSGKKATATTVELNLPKSTIYENQTVCMFVKDLDKDDRDYEKTKYHYQNLLKKSGLKQIPDIIPVKNLLLEYKSYEAKRNLSNMYDVFLTDSRVAKVLPRILGKHFYGRKRIPKRVIMSAKSLKNEINAAINRCNYVMSMKGSSSMVSVAHNKMKANDIVDNVIAAVKQISDVMPGGGDNIRNLYIRTADSAAIPLYISLDSSNFVELPQVNTETEIDEDVPEELTTLEDGQKVKVTKSGDVLIYTKEGKRLSVSAQSKLLKQMSVSADPKKKRKTTKAVNEVDNEYDELLKEIGGNGNSKNKKKRTARKSKDKIVNKGVTKPQEEVVSQVVLKKKRKSGKTTNEENEHVAKPKKLRRKK